MNIIDMLFYTQFMVVVLGFLYLCYRLIVYSDVRKNQNLEDDKKYLAHNTITFFSIIIAALVGIIISMIQYDSLIYSIVVTIESVLSFVSIVLYIITLYYYMTRITINSLKDYSIR